MLSTRELPTAGGCSGSRGSTLPDVKWAHGHMAWGARAPGSLLWGLCAVPVPLGDLLCLASLQAVPGMARLLLRLSRSNSPYLPEPVSLLSGAFHLQIPF